MINVGAPPPQSNMRRKWHGPPPRPCPWEPGRDHWSPVPSRIREMQDSYQQHLGAHCRPRWKPVGKLFPSIVGTHVNMEGKVVPPSKMLYNMLHLLHIDIVFELHVYCAWLCVCLLCVCIQTQNANQLSQHGSVDTQRLIQALLRLSDAPKIKISHSKSKRGPSKIKRGPSKIDLSASRLKRGPSKIKRSPTT